MRAALFILAAFPAFAQMQDVDALQSAVFLKSWQANYPRDRFEKGHYDTSNDKYQVDFARRDRWCGASIGTDTDGHSRTALFYLPNDLNLPPNVANCQLGAIWYEAGDAAKRDWLVSDLIQSWGEPNGTTEKPDIQGSAYWRKVAAWHRGDVDAWVAVGQNQPLPQPNPPAIAYARRRMPRDWDLQSLWFNNVPQSQSTVSPYVSALAHGSVVLAGRIEAAAQCVETPLQENFRVADLESWLKEGNSLPASSRAAHLLMADFYITCAEQSRAASTVAKSAQSLGARFDTLFPQDGPQYIHNFRAEAEALDPHGLIGELAGLVTLTDSCYLDGKQSWLESTITKATVMLHQFPEDMWTPYVRFILGRAHATKLSFAQGGDPESAPHSLSAAQIVQERESAIAQFGYMLKASPGSPEATFAAQETWRLRAGLAPSQIHFGCSGE